MSIVPHWWNVFYEGDTYSPTLAGPTIDLGKIPPAKCAATSGDVSVEAEEHRGFTVYTVTFVNCDFDCESCYGKPKL